MLLFAYCFRQQTAVIYEVFSHIVTIKETKACGFGSGDSFLLYFYSTFISITPILQVGALLGRPRHHVEEEELRAGPAAICRPSQREERRMSRPRLWGRGVVLFPCRSSWRSLCSSMVSDWTLNRRRLKGKSLSSTSPQLLSRYDFYCSNLTYHFYVFVTCSFMTESQYYGHISTCFGSLIKQVMSSELPLHDIFMITTPVTTGTM